MQTVCCSKHNKPFWQDYYKQFVNEVLIMNRMEPHQNLIHLEEVLYDEQLGKYCLVLEYAQNGQILNWNE